MQKKEFEFHKDIIYEYSGQKAEDLIKTMNSTDRGLSEKEALDRLKIYGHNEIAKKKKMSIARHILSKLFNPLILLLGVIVVFSFIFGQKISAMIVLMMILVSVFLDFFQEHKSEKAMEKLQEIIRTKITVYRDRQKSEKNISELVPGDVIELYAGDMIPADVRIIECKDLFINQSSLTGESFPVAKQSEEIKDAHSLTDLTNTALMGSSVVSGSGFGIVLTTGIRTQFGEVSKKLVEERAETSFDKGLKSFTMLMMKIIMILVVFIFVVLYVFKSGTFTQVFIFSLAVAVGLAPEMLPMIVSLNLSKGARVMARKKVIVKRLSSIQNFGAMDVLCTDKTGTLTEDNIVLEKHCDVRGKESEDVLKFAVVNSFYQTGLKNVLDKAILKHEHLVVKSYKKIDEIPFDFSRKIMSVVVEDKKRLLISKGAPEEIFKRCDRYEIDGKVHKLTGKILDNLKKEYDSLSAEGFRVVAVAYRELDKKDKNKNSSKTNLIKKRYEKEDEKELVLKGYLAFLDPAKQSTREVIKSLNDLGIEIKVLTGDNEIVTKKICGDVDINIKGILVGDEIDKLSDSELSVAVEKTTIFARLTPMQKARVIGMLRVNEHVVGYLGDGINDAPSLKAADVGISVNNAVDVAKESADIILLEKSLMVLKEGVLDGRKIFGNILKYIKMGASSNFGNMISMTGASLFLPFLPMLPIQIILNNFLYDMSNISLPSDDVDKEYLEQPRKWNMNYIKKFMLFIGPISSIFDFMTFGIMIWVFHASQSLFQTGWFIESLFSQTLIIYIIRTNKIPFVQSNPSKAIIATTLGILAIAVIIPFTALAKFFGFTPLPLLYFALLGGMVILYGLMVQIVKMWLVRKYKYQ